jgi:hypothetical protein
MGDKVVFGAGKKKRASRLRECPRKREKLVEVWKLWEIKQC